MGQEDLLVRHLSLLYENVQSRKVGPKGVLGTQAMSKSRRLGPFKHCDNMALKLKTPGLVTLTL